GRLEALMATTEFLNEQLCLGNAARAAGGDDPIALAEALVAGGEATVPTIEHLVRAAIYQDGCEKVFAAMRERLGEWRTTRSCAPDVEGPARTATAAGFFMKVAELLKGLRGRLSISR
ncbi:MAG: hypothetical protein AB1778_04825, partial [Candidatus Bipolaricaulota bacterium]